MHLFFIIIGCVLLVQSSVGMIQVIIEGPISFVTIGKQIDEDLIQIALGLCSIQIGRMTKSKSK